MFSYVWPVALVVISNVFYHICTKSTPQGMNPMVSLTVTYLTGTVVSLLLFFVLNPDVNLLKEYSKVTWTPFVLGVAIVGLELGSIYAYRAGWPVSTLAIVESAFLAVLLVFVGKVIYQETFSVKKIIGLVICLVGLYFLNSK